MKRIILLPLLVITINLFAQIPTDSLLLNLPLNGNASDESGNSLNGVINGATPTTNRYGDKLSAYFFDGTDDYIEISNFGDVIPTKEITVSMWAKSYTSKAQFQMMLCPDANRFGISVNYYHAGINTNFWDFGWTGAGGNAPGRLYFRPEVQDTSWHHYTFVSSISGTTMKIYKDNKLQIEESDPLKLLNPEGKSLKIGSGDNGSYFNGCLDDIKIYKRALDSTEINELYFEGKCREIIYDTNIVYNTINLIPTDSLLLDLPLNSNAIDESGNDLNGVINGATPTTNRYGEKHSAYLFDGTNDYIEILDFGDAAPTQEITVSMWAKSYSSKAQFQMMLCPDANRFGISVNYYHANINTNFWDFGWTGAGGNAPGRLYFRPEVQDTSWHHYAFVSSISGNTMKIYKDNELQIEETDPLKLLKPEGKSLKIGSGENGYYFKGCLDDIKIYKRALTTFEINALYEEGESTETIYDTVIVYITVTDTLNVDVKLETASSIYKTNHLKIFPNPAKDIIYINNGDYSSMNYYQMKIINSSSQVIFESYIDEPEFKIDLSKFGSTGLYFVQIIDSNSNIIDIKKIVLE